ncbi:AER370Wp [Eremothecium gossypii ATCC 10895]|uniref:AER370Wp n=1 Tax=Eremothecium gossypii (strain ATCC 10895 / CBS 109.51 / FGSC 9923 / NRRL Y-1056) TaxID=284811 RepID=Q755Z7_EREGS|nr:AER370Wp [Eremothecium gossypii ATCC 10895]AAS53050.2 AER370Wp [Eremothecium gossypii ATCC 10895]AEY97358.1 FAER370Wp [Eremothecium gossypii FDAG1]
MSESAGLGLKRRRVTRACDECRKKKVKCDSRHPCIHCTVYSYECTYNQPARRAGGGRGRGEGGTEAGAGEDVGAGGVCKKGPHSRVRYLQNKIAKFERVLGEVFPGLVDERTIDEFDVETFKKLFANCIRKDVDVREVVAEYRLIVPCEEPGGVRRAAAGDAAEAETEPFSQEESKEIRIILPPKPIAIEFVKNVWENCCVLYRFYHRPTFIRKLDDLYETDPREYTHEQLRFLPLCYAVMAVGALFSSSMLPGRGSEDAGSAGRVTAATLADTDTRHAYLHDEGYRYYVAAKKLVDLTNARDTEAIQTLCILFVFSQCSARLSTGHSYVCLAMKSALREGFHRKLSPEDEKKYSPLEQEMRKRLFYTLYKMEVFVNTMLGLPSSLSKDDYDQSLPLEISDKYISDSGIHAEQQRDILSSSGVANQHTKLIMIMEEIAAQLYPVKRTGKFISHKVISALELKLRSWLDQLPAELVPGLKDVPERYYMANRMLHLSFLHVQLILYRPFINYLSRSNSSSTNSTLSVQRAKNCISVARTVISLAAEMFDKGMLVGTSWFSIYTIFFSVTGLNYYVREVTPTYKQAIAEYKQILESVELGTDILSKLKTTSVAAGRIYNVLFSLFKPYNPHPQVSASLSSTPNAQVDDDDIKQQRSGYNSVNNSVQELISIPETSNASFFHNWAVDPSLKAQEQVYFSGPSLPSGTPVTNIKNPNTPPTLPNNRVASSFSGTLVSLIPTSSTGRADTPSIHQTPSTTMVNSGSFVPEEDIGNVETHLFGRYLPPSLSQDPLIAYSLPQTEFENP